MTVVVDTDALIGLFIETDAHHAAAHQLHQTLTTQAARLMVLPTTISEFALVASSKIGRAFTQRAVNTVLDMCELHEIRPQVSQRAISLYVHQTSKENSLFDCYVMAACEDVGAEAIFSFDKGYRSQGFTLLSS